jgi:hypothetical protein
MLHFPGNLRFFDLDSATTVILPVSYLIIFSTSHQIMVYAFSIHKNLASLLPKISIFSNTFTSPNIVHTTIIIIIVIIITIIIQVFRSWKFVEILT